MLKLLPIILFFSLGCYAQGEANNWYFGHWSGVDFNGANPVKLTNGQIYTEGGSASISDANGQLLFYTTGVKVWDKQHNVMPNGNDLINNYVNGQSTIIIPKPGSPNIYYIISSPGLDINMNSATWYSEVDMSLNNGLGDVTTNKNIVITTNTARNIAAIKKSNDEDYWFILNNEITDKFYVYSLTASGINLNPIISSSQSANNGSSFFSGYLKFSPDGSKIARAVYGAGVTLYDFDLNNGTVSNPKIINNHFDSYGIEFSPSGDVLYTTRSDNSYNQLLQYDLTSSNISATEKIISIGHNMGFHGSMGCLQYAPDGKIYLGYGGSYALGVINDPDNLGLSCNFDPVGLQLFGESELDLPQFVRSVLDFGIKTKNKCLGENTTFSLISSQTLVSIAWDFGDGTTSHIKEPAHIYATPGKYAVSVSATSALGKNITRKKVIEITAIPNANQPQNMFVCDNDNDGLYSFDLTSQKDIILNGQDSNLFDLTYYRANYTVISSPENYKNATPYQQETITVEVSNKVNMECKSRTTFNIDVFDTPKPNLSTAIPDLKTCDNTSVGTENDGKVIFDLTKRKDFILNGQLESQFQISYYQDISMVKPILNPAAYQNLNSNETIYVKVENKDNPNCFASTSFKTEVFALPASNSVIDLKQCDDDIDGFSIFNLEEAIGKITSNTVNESVSFFGSYQDAENNVNSILNVRNYTNQTVSTDKVFFRVSNANNCFVTGQLNLIVSTTQIPLSFKRNFSQCDDAILGGDTDGIASFDFSAVTSEIQNVFPTGQQLDINYYTNLADALAEKNSISDISNYRNIGYPNKQKIYIRVDSRLNNECLALGDHITLEVKPVPKAQAMTQVHCDDNQDGLYAFETSTIQANLLNGLTNVTVSYFDQNGDTLPSPLPNPFLTASQTVKVVVTTNEATGCSFETTLKFVVDRLPQAFAIDPALTKVCDDEINPVLQDGKYAFDSSNFQATILGGQTGMVVKYSDSKGVTLPSPLPNPFVTDTQNIKVEVFNPSNPTCFATTNIVFVVNPLPEISLSGDELVCSDLPTFTKIINAGLRDESQKGNFDYIWTFNGDLIEGGNTYQLSVNKKGVYKVEVINSEGCSRTRSITVDASDKAVIKVEVDELSSENTINVVASGSGQYVFSLDDKDGNYQTDNTFYNVSSGIHNVFVKDLNGCGIVSQEIAILGIPNYFTPNQDGYNDTWNLRGINANFNSKTKVQIFDRFGKLIKEINPLGEGWDGMYLGHQMPASDYWYSIQLEDGRILKGHFSLKR